MRTGTCFLREQYVVSHPPSNIVGQWSGLSANLLTIGVCMISVELFLLELVHLSRGRQSHLAIYVSDKAMKHLKRHFRSSRFILGDGS